MERTRTIAFLAVALTGLALAIVPACVRQPDGRLTAGPPPLVENPDTGQLEPDPAAQVIVPMPPGSAQPPQWPSDPTNWSQWVGFGLAVLFAYLTPEPRRRPQEKTP